MHSLRSDDWKSYLNSLPRKDQWAHCGSSEFHDPHLRDVTFNEGTYHNILCVGTPKFNSSCSDQPLSVAAATTTKPSLTRPTWDDYFLGILPALARRSTCNRGRSAAIFVRENDQVAAGYVGSPPGMPHCDDVGHIYDATGSHCIRTIHAEQNAMLRALRHGISLRDTTVYCTMTPCYTCAKLMVSVGVYRVVALHQYHDNQHTQQLFDSASVLLIVKSQTQLYEPQEQKIDTVCVNDTASISTTLSDNDDNKDLMCPVHHIMFSQIERSLDGRRICSKGCTWRVLDNGVMIDESSM